MSAKELAGYLFFPLSKRGKTGRFWHDMNKENMKAFVAVKIPVQGIKSLSYQRVPLRIVSIYRYTYTGTHNIGVRGRLMSSYLSNIGLYCVYVDCLRGALMLNILTSIDRFSGVTRRVSRVLLCNSDDNNVNDVWLIFPSHSNIGSLSIIYNY